MKLNIWVGQKQLLFFFDNRLLMHEGIEALARRSTVAAKVTFGEKLHPDGKNGK